MGERELKHWGRRDFVVKPRITLEGCVNFLTPDTTYQRLVILLVGALFFSTAHAGAPAQGGQTTQNQSNKLVNPARRLLDVRVRNLDLRKAGLFDTLRFLSQQAQLQLVIDPDVKDRKVTIKVKDLPLRHVLELLLYSEGLDFQVSGPDVLRVG